MRLNAAATTVGLLPIPGVSCLGGGGVLGVGLGLLIAPRAFTSRYASTSAPAAMPATRGHISVGNLGAGGS